MAKELTRAISKESLRKRWGVSIDRINLLLELQVIRSFRVPSVGRYGAAVRIPIEEVERIEKEELPKVERPKGKRKVSKSRHGV